jgi:hypothetical protein
MLGTMRYPITATLLLAVSAGIGAGAVADAGRKAARDAEVEAVLMTECVAKRSPSESAGDGQIRPEELCQREIELQAATRKKGAGERALPVPSPVSVG